MPDPFTLFLSWTRMLHSFLDHLVITASSLEEGIQYIHRNLQVSLETGGSHPQMGTYNCLLKLGCSQYLEVIAVDPRAMAPKHPRWFELDRTETWRAPRLAGWVARVEDIQAATIAVAQACGHVVRLNRGDLEWRITIPEDGSLPFQGVAPMLIQWSAGRHPSQPLPDQGCSLIKLEGYHPQADRITSLLQTIGFQDRFELAKQDTPVLVAHIQTPNGMRRLSSNGDSNG